LISGRGVKPTADIRVRSSQQTWLRIRKELGRHYAVLAKTAAQLYPEPDRVVNTGLITRSDWLFSQPIDLSDLLISLVAATSAPFITGAEDDSCDARPLLEAGRRYSRYSHAMRDIAKPRLFVDNPGWRLIDVDFSSSPTRSLVFGDTTYFEVLDVCEALAHETAIGHLSDGGRPTPASWKGLPFRRLLGDPFDFSRRPVMPSTDTLTIRAEPAGASFVLHYRDSSSVASSGGMLGLIPAGAFQPSTARREDSHADFDLWRNIMREYSEELLGNSEHVGGGARINYNNEPFRSLDRGLRAGKIRAFCFGIAFDALTLWAELLTAVVFDADIYDRIFANMIITNAEGSIAQIGLARRAAQIPFKQHVIGKLTASGHLTPEAAGCLNLAWKHRRHILV
jgi:hypothetical protein